MRLVRDYNGFKLHEFESKSELDEHIKVNQGVLVNANCEDKKRFYEISVESPNSVIGILSGGHGIEPSAVIVDDFECILIGIDKSVFCMDLHKCSLRWVMDFDSIVYTMVKITNSSFLVICELGVVNIDCNGERLWEHMSDVVTNFEIEDKVLRLFTDEDECSLYLDNGSII